MADNALRKARWDLLQIVSGVNSTLVHVAYQALSVHREANIALLEIVYETRDYIVSKVRAHRTHLLLVTLPFRLLLCCLRLLAGEDIGVEGKGEAREVDGLGLLSLGLTITLLTLAIRLLDLLAVAALRLLLVGLLFLQLFGNVLPHLRYPVTLDQFRSEDRHSVRVSAFVLLVRRTVLFQPVDIQRRDATLGLYAGLKLVLLVLLVPYRMLLDSHGLAQLSKRCCKALMSGDDILALDTTVVDLVLALVALLEDSGDNALANNALAHVVDHDRTRCEQALDIELVDISHSLHILASSYASRFITAIAGKGAYAICAKRVEDVAVYKNLCISRLGRVQGRDFASSHHDGTTDSGFVVLSEQLAWSSRVDWNSSFQSLRVSALSAPASKYGSCVLVRSGWCCWAEL
ncbi:putative eukaryotic translation initiation factor 3 subunit CLU1/TIF31 [Hortaea werneckii]|nr:putative eukaryotic translation initiation factor 3 subunit CLU1/TIF31 [Hortaea werneckii]